MRNSIKAVCAVGSAALIISGSAMAQAVPTLGSINFGDLAVGTSDADCVTAVGGGATCNTLATGAGFVQRQIDVNGLTYIQTVIDDGAGFQSEDFVQIKFGNTGAGTPGVASKLSLYEGTTAVDGGGVRQVTGTGFVTDSTIFSGWANPAGAAGDSKALIRVDVGDVQDAKNEFNADFSVDTDFIKASGENRINSMVADQTVMLGETTDIQRFVTQVKAAGAAQTDFTFGALSQGPGVSFDAGEMIQVVWVGQQIAGLGSFGSNNLQNIDAAPVDATKTTSSISNLTSTGPFNWTGTVLETEFGTAPTF